MGNQNDIKKDNRGTIIWVVALSLIVITYILLVQLPRKVVMTVDSAFWRSQVNVQQYVTKTKADFYLPFGAKLIKSENELCGYEQILSHYKEVEKTKRVSDGGLEEKIVEIKNSDGTVRFDTIKVPTYTEITYTEQEPVYVKVPKYDQRYYFEVGEWDVVRSVIEEGTDSVPYYGVLNLQPNESIANQYCNYYVRGNSTAKEYYMGDEVTVERELRISADDMTKIQSGQKLELFVLGDKVLHWKVLDIL